MLTNFERKMSFLGLLDAKINKKKKRTTGNYRDGCEFCGGGGSTQVAGGSGCGDGGDVSSHSGIPRNYDDLTP